MNLFSPKFIFKVLWFSFGLAGLVITTKPYLSKLSPQLKNSPLVKGVQEELGGQTLGATETDVTQAITKIITQEVTKILTEQTEVIKTLPAKQIRKIKIGACEELLEEDICAVADCQV